MDQPKPSRNGPIKSASTKPAVCRRCGDRHPEHRLLEGWVCAICILIRKVHCSEN